MYYYYYFFVVDIIKDVRKEKKSLKIIELNAITYSDKYKAP